jgi:tetratricopeptide (TPR) repeat protein
MAGDLEGAAAALAREMRPDLPMISMSQREAWFETAELQIARGEYSQAARILESLAEDRSGGSPGIMWKRGVANLGAGRLDSAQADLERALELSRKFEMKPMLWQVLLSIAALRDAQDRPDDAAECRKEALAVVQEISRTIDDPLMRQRFLEAAPIAALRSTAAGASF